MFRLISGRNIPTCFAHHRVHRLAARDITATALSRCNPWSRPLLSHALRVVPVQVPVLPPTRSFSTAPKKQKKRTKGQKKAAKRKESEQQKAYNRFRDKEKGLKRMNNLHPAAKFKRILSACEFWFSQKNLAEDHFLRAELQDYQGHVRISTLASFAKFQYWADKEDILTDALENDVARKKFKVIFNQELVEKVARNRQRQIIRHERDQQLEKNQHKKDAKVEKRRRLDRRKELREYMDKTRKEFWTRRWKQLQKERKEEEDAKEQEVREEQQRERQKALSQMTTAERLLDFVSGKWKNTKEALVQVTKYGTSKSENEDDEDDDGRWEWYDCDNDEEELMYENEQFRSAVLELEDIEESWSDFHARGHLGHPQDDNKVGGKRKTVGGKRKNKSSDRRKNLRKHEMDLDSLIEKSKADRLEDLRKTKADLDCRIDPKDWETDEELPSPIVDDESTNYKFALVRPKKVDASHYTGSPVIVEDESDSKIAEKKPKPKRKSLPKYKGQRTIQVIKNTKQLASFCRSLKDSIKQSKTSAEDAAIGFDVEYCTLEMDIRGTLPAMLQLASPDPEGPIGLVWLDKFPNHGKGMIGDKKCADLFSLLNDSTISKVGVGASKDAKHLAAWWGITDAEHANYYFSGIVDMEVDLLDDRTSFKSLQEMCESVLERDLPKLKEKNAKAKKEKRKKGKRALTSHWRRDDLTKEMKQYAADDVSCAIDIWQKMQQEQSLPHADGNAAVE